MKSASEILSENILLLFEETARSANDVGNSAGIGQTTVSAWIRKAKESDPSFNPRLSQLTSFARAFGYTVADLFSENLGRGKQALTNPNIRGMAAVRDRSYEDKADSMPAVSPGTLAVLKRLEAAEAAGSTTPELFRALEAVLDLARPIKTGGGYDGLDRMSAE
jgi:hypothetical protein